jgi:hypothetical protein
VKSAEADQLLDDEDVKAAYLGGAKKPPAASAGEG